MSQPQTVQAILESSRDRVPLLLDKIAEEAVFNVDIPICKILLQADLKIDYDQMARIALYATVWDILFLVVETGKVDVSRLLRRAFTERNQRWYWKKLERLAGYMTKDEMRTTMTMTRADTHMLGLLLRVGKFTSLEDVFPGDQTPHLKKKYYRLVGNYFTPHNV